MSSSMPGGRGYFPTTHWSEVAAAGQTDPELKREALGRLVMKYLPALRAHLVWKGVARQEAEDLVQDFVAGKVVEKGLIAGADRQLGRFRTYLLTALDRFVANQLRDRISSKRHPASAALVDIENCSAAASARPTATPPDTVEAAWARQLVHEALERMKRHCLDSGQEKLWELFLDRIAGPTLEGAQPSDYRTLVQRLDLESPVQVGNLLTTAKRLYARILRAVVGEYAAGEEEVETEIRELREILGRRGA